VRRTRDLVRDWIALHEADLTFYDRIDALRRAVLEELGGDTDSRWIWIRDATEEWVVFEDSGSGSPSPGLYQVGYSQDDAGVVAISWPATEVEAHTTYTPVVRETPLPVPTTVGEAAADLEGDFIALVESSVRADGTVPIKVMTEGWGTSGYYTADVIKRDGPAAFVKGTQMYWDHPTITEANERPERSLRDLSAVLEGAAYWDDAGPEGAGLYANAQVFDGYRPAIDELAEHIGVSIRALGRGHHGEAEGRRGLIIDQIVEGRSIDFVTAAGAGGKVLALFESARGSGPQPIPIRTNDPKESDMDLSEATAANKKLTAELAEATQLGAWAAAERDAEQTKTARLTEAGLIRDARAHAQLALLEAKLPDPTKVRIVETVCTNPPATSGGALDREKLSAQLVEAAKIEAKYLEEAGLKPPGTVTGLGTTVGVSATDDAAVAQLADGFQRLGLSESAAKLAAAGR